MHKPSITSKRRIDRKCLMAEIGSLTYPNPDLSRSHASYYSTDDKHAPRAAKVSGANVAGDISLGERADIQTLESTCFRDSLGEFWSKVAVSVSSRCLSAVFKADYSSILDHLRTWIKSTCPLSARDSPVTLGLGDANIVS